MSGSSKKKLRKEQKMAAMTEKQRQAAKEAKSLKAYTMTFVVVMVLVVAMVVGIAVRSPIEGLINKNTHAVTIGNHELTIPEFSYFFVDEINSYYMDLYNSYGSYASYFLGFTAGKSLDDQIYDKETGKTWARYFMDEAAESAQTVFGLYDLAVKEGHKLTEDEQTTLDQNISDLEKEADSADYSTNGYLKLIYGNGADIDTYKEYSAVSALASSYYAKHAEDLEESYTDDTFRKFEADKIGQYHSYSYLMYEIAVKNYLGEGKKDESGNITYTDEEKAAALAAAKADVQRLLDAGIINEETFNSALLTLEVNKKDDKKEEDKKDEDKKDGAKTDSTDATGASDASDATDASDSTGATDSTSATKPSNDKTDTKVPLCTVGEDALWSSLPTQIQEWVTGENKVMNTVTSVEIKTEKAHEHEEGEEHSDDEEKEYETTGFYVILLTGENKNDMKLVNVRHILISLENITDKSTEAQKKEADEKAKAEADKLLAEWKAGAATAESFGELANKYSKDPGSNTNGGLYEEIYPGWAVEEFNDWCFAADRKAGDSAVVKTENGYHVMYLDSFSDYTYRNYMIMNDKLSEDLEAYLEGIVEATSYTEVDLDRMNWDITFG